MRQPLRQLLDAQITEKAFQQQIIDLARLNGFRVYHTRDSRGSEAGFPDLVMARDYTLIFAEVKTERGRLTAAQVSWLAILERCSAMTYVWRPSDWDAIVAVLARKTGHT